VIIIRLLCVCVCLGLFACAGTPGDEREPFFEVTGLQFGKMRESEEGRWEVYQNGPDLRYEVNGVCQYDGEAYPCMWYGSVINYRTNHEKLTLECQVHARQKLDWGNADETQSEQSQRFDFTLTFSSEQTVKRTPNYIIASATDSVPDHTDFTCHHEGREVLSYSLIVTYEETQVVDELEQANPRIAAG
jgi:hypothetical protein